MNRILATAIAFLASGAARGEERAAPPPVDDAKVVLKVDSSAPGTVIEKLDNRQEGVQLAVALPIYLPMYAWQSTWEPICVAPCKVAFDRNGVFRVGKYNGISGSKPFTLPADVTQIHVDARSVTPARLGIALSILGTLAVGAGGLIAYEADTPGVANPTAQRYFGWGVAAVGLAAIAIGLPLWILTRSNVRF